MVTTGTGTRVHLFSCQKNCVFFTYMYMNVPHTCSLLSWSIVDCSTMIKKSNAFTVYRSDEVYPGMFLFFCFLFLVTGCTPGKVKNFLLEGGWLFTIYYDVFLTRSHASTCVRRKTP